MNYGGREGWEDRWKIYRMTGRRKREGGRDLQREEVEREGDCEWGREGGILTEGGKGRETEGVKW